MRSSRGGNVVGPVIPASARTPALMRDNLNINDASMGYGENGMEDDTGSLMDHDDSDTRSMVSSSSYNPVLAKHQLKSELASKKFTKI